MELEKINMEGSTKRIPSYVSGQRSTFNIVGSLRADGQLDGSFPSDLEDARRFFVQASSALRKTPLGSVHFIQKRKQRFVIAISLSQVNL
jgi:hypothetical protein